MYTEVRGIAPDLMLYTDDLKYRVAGTIGHKQLSIPTNDTGPDHINHDFEGIFIHSGPGIAGKLIQNISIYDIFPMICNLFRII
jgi:predicted AlkP superfamily phosphohydrolase/phosphomutase